MRARPRTRTALVLVLVACASGPSPSEISEKRNAATSFVLTQKVFALSLAKQCRFDPGANVDLSSRAQTALATWEQHNQARLAAATRYFEDYLSVVARREGIRKAAERRGELTNQFNASGARAAQTSVERAGGRERCPQLLEALARGEFDIESEEFSPTIDELVARYAAPAN